MYIQKYEEVAGSFLLVAFNKLKTHVSMVIMTTSVVNIDWSVRERKKLGRDHFPLGLCLLPRKFCKIFHILRHIESLDACMKY